MIIKFHHSFHSTYGELNTLFKRAGYSLYLAGGAVRDIIMDTVPKDYDFSTDATPEIMKEILKDYNTYDTGIDHGTITVLVNDIPYEITTFRHDTICDGRHAVVTFSKSMKDDSERRDFTINAMYADIEGNVYDFHNGLDDIKNKIVRFVGDADTRIQEDALRILRYARFVACLGFDNIDSKTSMAIGRNAELLRTVSKERVWEEYKKACKTVNTLIKYKDMLTISGINPIIKMPNVVDPRIHDMTSDFCKDMPELYLAFYVRDVDDVFKIRDDGMPLSNKEFKNLSTFRMLIDIYKDCDPTIKQLKRLIIIDKIDLRILNAFAHYKQSLNLFGLLVLYSMTPIPTFPVSGDDLISMGYKQGPNLGRALDILKERWVESDYIISKEELLKNAIPR